MFISNLSEKGKVAFKVVHLQLLFVILIGSATYVQCGNDAARFILKGGMIAVVGNYMFALFAFIPKPDEDGSVLLGFIFIGWALKLVVTIILFILVFSLTDLLNPGAFFTGYKLTLLMFWFAPILFFSKNGINHG
jgi:F0F1-type ATP synthase assembly protein I